MILQVLGARRPCTHSRKSGSSQGCSWGRPHLQAGLLIRIEDIALQLVRLHRRLGVLHIVLSSSPFSTTLLSFALAVDGLLVGACRIGVPAEVQGWHLLAKSNISKEQKQMVMTQANSLERTKTQQALYSILGRTTSTTMFRTPADGPPLHALLEKVVVTMWTRTTTTTMMMLGAIHG